MVKLVQVRWLEDCGAPKYFITHGPSDRPAVSTVSPHVLITDNKVVYSQGCTGSVQEGEREDVSLLADRDSSYSFRSGPTLSPFTSSPEHRGLS